ncbi:MAG: hypothetical protein F6K39_26405 [Okeania sp. SIO3B3]|nr:hypothetical protein [Okeania sp. SIO3B3]
MAAVPIKGFDSLVNAIKSVKSSNEKIAIENAKIITEIAINNQKLQRLIDIFGSKNDIQQGDEEVPVELKISLDMPTGEKFYLPNDFYSYDGRSYLEDKGDSELGINGFKAFSFASYDQNISNKEGYEFFIEIDSQFTTVDYDSKETIQLHKITNNTIDTIRIWLAAGWQHSRLGYLPEFPLEGLKTWALGVHNLPESMVLRPDFLTKYYYFKVRINTGGYRIAVFDYNHANKTFKILGY